MAEYWIPFEQAQAELARDYMVSWAKKRNISCVVDLFSGAFNSRNFRQREAFAEVCEKEKIDK